MINMLHLEIVVIAALTAVTCCIPGVFLVLRGVAMMSDAISHAILLGIVIMFLMVKQLTSIWLIIGASMSGVLTVVGTEIIIRSNRLKQDAAIGLIFPLFFSIAVVLISFYARNVHLDSDMVLLGELLFAPFNRLVIYNVDCGPYALWIVSVTLLINVLFIWLFYKELVITTFDTHLALMSGISPLVFYYCLMILTSLTAVATFDIVGSIMVVALMITPSATAYLLTHRVNDMIICAVAMAVSSAFLGCGIAAYADVSIAGSIAAITGVFFCGVLFVSKNKFFLA